MQGSSQEDRLKLPTVKLPGPGLCLEPLPRLRMDSWMGPRGVIVPPSRLRWGGSLTRQFFAGMFGRDARRIRIL